MNTHFHEDHLVVVDGEQTRLLSHLVCESGIVLSVSGPEQILLHEHTVTELDGSPVRLDNGE